MNSGRDEGGREAALFRRALYGFVLATVMLLLVTCEDQDPTAPEGSTITVTANPQTIVLAPGATTDEFSDITATVRGKSGARLPDQEVFFTTSQGRFRDRTGNDLDPIQITDSKGRAEITLSTSVSASVMALSGSITGSTTIQVATGVVASILINPDPNVPNNDDVLDTCNDTVHVLIEARDAGGVGIGGITVSIVQRVRSGFADLKGILSRSSAQTDSNGEIRVRYEPPTNCPGDCENATCGAELVASSQGISSTGLLVTETLP